MNNGSIYEGMMGGMWLKQKKGNGIPQIFKFPHLKIADFFKFFYALIYWKVNRVASANDSLYAHIIPK